MRDRILAAKLLLSLEIEVKIWQFLLTNLSLVIGSFLVGLVIFGWWLAPVQWEPDDMNNAPYHSQVVYVHVLSEWYAYSGDLEKVPPYLEQLNTLDNIACQMAAQENQDLGRKARLIKLAWLKNGVGCYE